VRESWRILTGLGIALGMKWKYSMTQDVFTEIASKIPGFRGLTFAQIDRRGAPIKEQEKTVATKGA
jgi:predicted molibdopterin-dependent oxidoreductase YjgC